MRKSVITIAFLSISSLAFCQETHQADSTRTLIKIKETVELTDVNAPLYILDNKEIAYKEVSKINTDNIQSITVLKDSTATARYGERGSRGVILIESKNHKKLPAKKRSTIE
jgi:TonB-dependent SusC/RagA subfamily outer membrane receptor